jgi:Domain of unknown function (DUF5666)
MTDPLKALNGAIMMLGAGNCLSPSVLFFWKVWLPYGADRHPKCCLRELSGQGDAMSRFFIGIVSPVILTGFILIGIAGGQAVPSQSALSASVAATVSNGPNQSLSEGLDIALDPASLLPDLPTLPPSKASLIGGTIQRLDRVRDQITVQVFGGGKMKIAFDTRTRFYRDGADATASDLGQGERIYVDTILDGSTVFARSIRLKTANSAGESQGTVTSYRADRGELEIRDSLSPRSLKMRITAQTRIIHGDHSVPASELAPGTLVAVKFGPRRDGTDVAQELSVLAVPGSSFTFAGRITSLDLRLGLLVLASSTDHKTYEIHFDPSVVGWNDNLHEAADVTVVTQFDGTQYVARTLTVNSPLQQ